MTQSLPQIILVRHGETEWTVSGRHTGRTDIDLTANGEAAARGLSARLAPFVAAQPPQAVWSSPSLRARRTCELSGFGAHVTVKSDLQEWDYGTYEGITTKEILARKPGWQLFRNGAPGGEDAAQAGARADRIIAEARAFGAPLMLFSSAHFLRVLGARWIGLPPQGGAHFVLGTASISVLGYEHDLEEPVLKVWNRGE